MEDGRSAFQILTGTPTGKRPLGRPRCRWEDKIRVHLKDIKCRLKARNSYYYRAQTLLSSRLHYKNLKIKMYKTIFPLVLCI